MLVTAAHLALLAWVGLRTPFTRMAPLPDPPPVEVFLVPPPPPVPRDSAADAPPSVVTPYRPRLIVPVAPAEVAPIPAPPAAPAPPGIGSRPSPSVLPGAWDGLRDAMRGSLVGCANRDRVGLTAAERAACDERLGRPPARTLPLAIDPAKHAGFEAAAAAKAKARREREGPMLEPMPACTGPMSNLGVGCNPNHQ